MIRLLIWIAGLRKRKTCAECAEWAQSCRRVVHREQAALREVGEMRATLLLAEMQIEALRGQVH